MRRLVIPTVRIKSKPEGYYLHFDRSQYLNLWKTKFRSIGVVRDGPYAHMVLRRWLVAVCRRLA